MNKDAETLRNFFYPKRAANQRIAELEARIKELEAEAKNTMTIIAK